MKKVKRTVEALPDEKSPVIMDPDMKVEILEFASQLQEELDTMFRSTTRQDGHMFGKSYVLPRKQIFLSLDGLKTYSYGSGAGNVPTGIFGPHMTSLISVVAKKYGVFDSALVNLYEHGKDKVSWHADDEKSVDKNAAIVSVSLGRTRLFRVRRKFTSRDAHLTPIFQHVLEHGDVVVMPAGMQSTHLHEVPAENTRVLPNDSEPQRRINITFRQYNSRKRPNTSSESKTKPVSESKTKPAKKPRNEK
jgi:alkylated DNA repair dioxygenase AlkB